MPTLEWIGKKAVVNHHLEVPFHLLQRNDALSVGETDSGNLLFQADNLLALKALLPYYAGQVKCIYIDPPYNTGNENWIYNDNANSLEIREWLGKVVGKEAEDLSRHDKWLCMMYPRLALLREFLRQDGAIFISIDDNEVANLRLMMDEIFGANNLVACLVWFKRVSPANDAKYFSSDHDYIVVYARNKSSWKPNKLERNIDQESNYTNPDNDPRGHWNSVTYTCNKSAAERPNLYYGIKNPITDEIIFPKKTAVWKYDEKRHEENVKQDLVYWGMKGDSKPRLKRFLSEMSGVVPRSILQYSDFGHTQLASTEIQQLISGVTFQTPKPTKLLNRLLQLATDKDSLILDSFAGSGTTGHAVLQLNKEDGGKRRFILVEMDKNICQSITAERVKRAINGYSYNKQKGNQGVVEGLGGGFAYCELAETLFDADGQIRAQVKFQDLARHVFFVETGEPLPNQSRCASPLIGIANNIAVYLLYNGILRDKTAAGGNVLTNALLTELPPHDGAKVIYATSCRIGQERLRRESIIFRQIPYEVRTR